MSEIEHSTESIASYVETFGACRLRNGVMYRGRIRAEYAEDIDALHRILATAPGEHHIEELDGHIYATICIYRPGKKPKQRLWLHIGLLVLTIITVLGAGAELSRTEPRGLSLIPFEFAIDSAAYLSEGQVAAVIQELLPRFLAAMCAGVPYAAALLFILLAHEMGHYIAARRYGIDATLPFLLPAPLFFGTVGAFIKMRTRIAHRRALFDVGIAGPIAGLVASVIVCFIGMRLSSHVPAADATYFPVVFGRCAVFRAMDLLVLGPVGPEDVLLWHPVLFAGWFGLFLTFVNLLPVGQLDGGHVCYALFGTNQRRVGIAAFAILMGMSIIFLGWAVLAVIVLLVARIGHPPLIDESISLGRGRQILALVMIVVFALLFVAMPVRPL